jgi:hypothetical protein
MPKYERYPGEPAARAKARIAKNVAKKKKKGSKKEVANVKRTRKGRKPITPKRMYV